MAEAANISRKWLPIFRTCKSPPSAVELPRDEPTRGIGADRNDPVVVEATSVDTD